MSSDLEGGIDAPDFNSQWQDRDDSATFSDLG